MLIPKSRRSGLGLAATIALCALVATALPTPLDASELISRCATPDRQTRQALYGIDLGGPSGTDCNAGSTNPTGDYDSTFLYEIPVVVHVIMDDACATGVISDAMVQSQIDILNEDFQALAGTNGANGTDVQLRFVLATEDPVGDPTNGITRNCNTAWFNDGGGYFNTLAWDPANYLNIYTNLASGALGYVPFLPADGGGANVGTNADRVVVLWDTFGRNAPRAPFDLGRTATHEVGHYLGLEHTFSGGCSAPDPPNCYTTGDLICDTNSETSPNFGCPGSRSTCSTPDPIDNYMDYSDDICMEMFTGEQSRRMRCTLQFWRPDLANVVVVGDPVFSDGFESGDTSEWTSQAP